MRPAIQPAMEAIPVREAAASPPAQVPVQNQLRPNLAVQVDPARTVQAVGRIVPAAGSPGAVRCSAEQAPPRPPPAVCQQQPEVQRAQPAVGAHREEPVVPVDQINLARQEVLCRGIDA